MNVDNIGVDLVANVLELRVEPNLFLKMKDLGVIGLDIYGDYLIWEKYKVYPKNDVLYIEVIVELSMEDVITGRINKAKHTFEVKNMNDTEYLNSSEANRESLQRSIEQSKGVDINQPVVDSDSVVSLMENMSIAELKMLKAACDLLIGFKGK